MSDYWEKRKEQQKKAQRMYEAMEDAEDTASEIAKIYSQATGYLNHQIEGIFSKYKTKHGLSEKEARRILNNVHDLNSFDDMLNELKKGVPYEKKRELLAILESPAYRYRINRIEDIQHQIDEMMKNVYHQEQERHTVHYINTAYDGYYKSIYDIQKATGYAFSFNAIDPQYVDRLLHSKWSGSNYSKRIWKNTEGLAQTLKEEILLSVMTQKTEKEVANEIANKFHTSIYNARRLVRTESCFISNQMEMLSYEECECETYVFLATLDMRTSKVCQSLDMKRFKVEDEMPGVNCPPMHPWCRSTTIAGLDDKTLARLKRRARDPKTGRNYLISNKSYPEWLKEQQEKYGKDNADKFRKKVVNRNTDKKQYERYKSVLKKEDVPKTFAKFQDLKYNNKEEWENLKLLYKATNNGWILQEHLDYELEDGETGFIPGGVPLTNIHVIAGDGSNIEIRDKKRLVSLYGGHPDEWSKKVGKVTSEKYMFDVHWYECNKKQYDAKVKVRKDRE